jgi:site-specific DNA recombinase
MPFVRGYETVDSKAAILAAAPDGVYIATNCGASWTLRMTAKDRAMSDSASYQTKRALIYARVSSEEQSRGYSLQTQLEAIRNYCSQEGYQVTGEYSDVHTGTEIDRPGINALLETADELRPDAVVLYDVDRLGRELIVQAVLDQEIERTGAEVEFVLGGKDELMRLIKGALAVYENRQRVERIRRGKLGRIKAGYPMAPGKRAPFGYTYISVPHKGYFEINEEEAAVVKQMVHWLLVDQLSSYEIAQRLWQEGILTRGDQTPHLFRLKRKGKGEWSPTTVRRILTNSIYKGEWYWGKTRREKRNGVVKQVSVPRSEWIMVEVPAILDADTWERVQTQLTANRTNSKRNAKREYLLRSMVFCTCGRRFVGRYKNKAKIAYYRCPNTEAEYWRNQCDARFSYRQERLESAVWNYVTEFLSHPDTMLAEIERQQAQQEQETAKRQRSRESRAAALASVDSKLGDLLRHELEGYPASVIEAQKRQLLEQRTDLEAELARLDRETSEQDITPDTVAQLRELAETVRIALPEMTPAERRQLLELLRLRVEVVDKENVRVSGIISESLVALSTERS